MSVPLFTYDSNLVTVFAALWGLASGSFAAVAIYRWPRGYRVGLPRRSYCVQCLTSLGWTTNVPVLGYLLSAGKCKKCKTSIGIDNFILELLCGFLFAVIVTIFGLTWTALGASVFSLGLVISTFVDLEHRIIPDEVSLGLIPFGLLFSSLPGGQGFLSAVVGCVAGGGVLWCIAWAYKKYSGQDGMGLGDVKLLAMIGSFVGVGGALATLMLASVLGAVIGGIAIVINKAGLRTALPFGPFLALGAFAILFCGGIIQTLLFGGLIGQ